MGERKAGKVLTVRLEEKHVEALKKIAEAYRIPDNASHAIRLMIEDKEKEINNK